MDQVRACIEEEEEEEIGEEIHHDPQWVLGVCEEIARNGKEEKRREEKRREDTYNHSDGDESEKTKDDPHGGNHGVENEMSFGLNTTKMTNRF